MTGIREEDKEALRREKYASKKDADMSRDLRRLQKGEPLAYVIGHIPFLGLSIALDSRPLIPRPETEWWAEELCKRIKEKEVRVLDLCAGSGAIGLSILFHCPNAHVSFGEISPKHTNQVRANLEANHLDRERADIRTGDLFSPFCGNDSYKFDIIATNPPYIDDSRILPPEVLLYEPEEALFAGPDGLSVINQILKESPSFLLPHGELWMECDIHHIETAKEKALLGGFSGSEIRTDQYGRPRLLVAYL